MLSYLLCIIAVPIIYFATLGVLVFILAKKHGAMFFNEQTNQWNIWFGKKQTSNKIDVVKHQGNLLSCLLFIINKDKVI